MNEPVKESTAAGTTVDYTDLIKEKLAAMTTYELSQNFGMSVPLLRSIRPRLKTYNRRIPADLIKTINYTLNYLSKEIK